MKNCKECNKEISNGSKLGFCKSCSHKGKLNINFGGLSNEHCKNLSKAGKGRPSAFKGKHHSRESKERNRQSHLGKKYPERCGKYNPACRPEVRAKMSKTRKGRKLTEAWKKKIAISVAKNLPHGKRIYYKGICISK